MPISKIPGAGLDTGSSGVAPGNLTTGGPYWDGSGNVGIGTTSPLSTAMLEVSRSTTVIPTATVTADNQVTGWRTRRTGGSYAYEYYMGIRENSTALDFYDNTANALRMRVDSAGRLGIGITPNTGWVTTWNVIDVGNSSGFTSPNDGNTIVCGNTYFNGSNWVRKVNTYAANIECNAAGKIATYTAASSTAGSTISWTSGPYVANLGTSWTNSSDERLKDIIEPITDAANKVGQLRAVIGKFKTDPEDKRRSFLIAQDVQVVLPEAVDASDPDSLGVQYTDVIPLLVAAIKEQQQMIETLQAKVAVLEAK